MVSRTVTRRESLLGLAASGAALPFAGPSRAAAPAECGLVVLTVGGLVGAPNRQPFNPARDHFFFHNNIEFRDARAFTFPDLLALSQETVTLNEDAGQTVYKGPLLHEALAAAKPLDQAKTARLSALDGYATEMALATAKDERWVLAVEADGNAFGIGDFGPLYAVRPLPPGQKRSDEEEARWVFSVYYIELMP